MTLCAHVLPEFREYERALTACMNSYVRPKVADYVGRLQSELQAAGANADVNILRSDAGLMTTREAARNPIYAVLSGPSGGVAGALFVARKAGFDDILTFDMGGTSTDVALCQNGAAVDRARDVDLALPHPRPVGRRPHGRRGRRVDRPRPAADEGAARRAGVGGRRARARPRTAGAASCRR